MNQKIIVITLFFITMLSSSGKDNGIKYNYAHGDGKIALYIHNTTQSSVVICDLTSSLRNAQILREGKLLELERKQPHTGLETVGDWLYIRGKTPDGGYTVLSTGKKLFDMKFLFKAIPHFKKGDKIRMTLIIRGVEKESGKLVLSPPQKIKVDFVEAL